MKKLYILLMLLLVAALAVTACGNDPVTTDNSENSLPAVSGSNANSSSSAAESTEPAPVTTPETTDELGNTSADVVESSYQEGDFVYTIFKNGAKLVSYTGNAAEVTLPDSIQGGKVKVTMIGSTAFGRHENLVKVTLPDSVTALANDVFYDCRALTDVKLPADLARMGDGVFRYCVSLKTVTFPASLSEIGTDIFYECTALETVALPEKITFLPAMTFYGCRALEHVTLPAGLSAIGEKAFAYCSLLPTLDLSGISALGERAFYNCVSMTELTLSDNLRNIPNYAFAGCASLTSVKLSPNTKSVGAYAFYGCEKLPAITLPETVTSVGIGAFAFCKGLTALTLPDAITALPARLFYNCASLAEVHFSDKITSIGEKTFSGSAITAFSLPASVTSVDLSAFAYCLSLRSFEIDPDSALTVIAQTAFEGCSALEAIHLPVSAVTINNGAFSGCSALETVILSPKTVKIGLNAFLNCPKIKEITIPDSVSEIGRNAVGLVTIDGVNVPAETVVYCFEGGNVANFLSGNNIPHEFIGYTGFVPYSELEAERHEDENGVTYVILNYTGSDTVVRIYKNYKDGTVVGISDEFLKDRADITEVNLPDTLTSIGKRAFEGCSSLAVVNFPASLSSIGEAAFAGTAITTVDLRSVRITAIPDEAFYGCGKLTSVSLHANTETIGARAFAGTGLQNITLANNIKKIGDEAFKDCDKLTAVILQCPAPEIGSGVLDGTIEGFTAFHYNAGNRDSFGITEEQEKADKEDYTKEPNQMRWNGYPITVRSLSEPFMQWYFTDAEGATTVVATLGYRGMLSITNNGAATARAMPDFASAEEAPWYPYRALITNVSFDRVSKIGDYALSQLTGITSLTISTATSIGKYALAGCSNLASLTLGGTITEIKEGAFTGTAITSIRLPDPLTVIPNDLFLDVATLSEVTMGANVTAIGDRAFKGTSVKLLSTAQALVSIGEEAFAGDTALTAVTTYATTIGARCFDGCSAITSLRLTGSLTEIGDQAFRGTAIVNVTLPNTLKKIGNQVFADCASLVRVSLEGDVPEVGEGILDNTPVYAHIFYFDNYQNNYDPNKTGAWQGYPATCSTTAIMASFTVDGGKGTVNINFNGLLTFVANEAGACIPDFASAEDAPWHDYADYITSLNLSDAASIGSYAFTGFAGFSSLSLGAKVRSVGAHAFENCDSLASVTLYASSVGEEAFAYCDSLVTIVLNNTETFGQRAFADCPILENVTFTVASAATSAGSASAFENTLYSDTVS